ncbi:MAG: hypothetical protein ACREJQ_02350 [bacterium]
MYVLEYRRNGAKGNFEFAGLIMIVNGKLATKYKQQYQDLSLNELSGVPLDLSAIAKSGDDLNVSRKSVIYSEDDMETLFEDYLDAEKRLEWGK